VSYSNLRKFKDILLVEMNEVPSKFSFLFKSSNRLTKRSGAWRRREIDSVPLRQTLFIGCFWFQRFIDSVFRRLVVMSRPNANDAADAQKTE
jgi:hypothetical protein